MKNICAIDSSTNLLSICLKSDDKYYESTYDCGLKHSENLLVLTDSLIHSAGISIKDLDLLIVSAGPGSFTGLRIAMSTVKGIATGLNIPYISVPTLDYLAWGYDYYDGAVVPLIDAKKKRFYTAVYHKGQKMTDDLDISPADLSELLKGYSRVLLTGPDCFKIQLESTADIFPDPNYFHGKSRQMLEIGIQKFKESGPDDISSGPIYIRKSEAEIAKFGE